AAEGGVAIGDMLFELPAGACAVGDALLERLHDRGCFAQRPLACVEPFGGSRGVGGAFLAGLVGRPPGVLDLLPVRVGDRERFRDPAFVAALMLGEPSFVAVALFGGVFFRGFAVCRGAVFGVAKFLLAPRDVLGGGLRTERVAVLELGDAG